MKDKAVSKLLTHRLRRRSSNTDELAARLAPPEELAKTREASHMNGSQVAAQENGAIVVGVEQSNLAKEVIDGEQGKGVLGLEPVVIIIAALLLAFIAFIAWQVSQMSVPE